ncbi:MAG: SLC13 family permease [bacterium]|jgi:di/tricarboxylate transporter
MDGTALSWEAWFTMATVVAIVGLLIFTRFPPDMILLGALTVLLMFNILTPDQALIGFSNEGMLTVGVLYIVVSGLTETGGVGTLVYRVLGKPKSIQNAQLRLMAPVIGMSAFLNNTPVVAMFIPAVIDWAKKYQISVSQLMIPLSYAAIFGGTCTLIGTSTNLVVNGMMLDHPELQSFGIFEIAWVGIPGALLGMAYILTLGKWLLPDRKPAISQLENPREYSIEVIVEAGSPLEGKTIEQAGLRNLPGMYLVEINRGEQVIPAVSPQEKLLGNDHLVFVGIVESVVDLHKIRGLTPATNQVFKLESPRRERILIETVVSNTCPLIGKTIREGKFRTNYNAVVIAVARNGKRINKKIGDIVLLPGDTLLLEAHPSFVERKRNSRDFFLISRIENSSPPRHEKSMLALGILISMIIVVALGLLSMLKGAMIAAGLMIITGCCSPVTARNSVELSVLLVIAASFGIGMALETTGAAAFLAQFIIKQAGTNPHILLAVVYLVTMCFTELITNNAAAVLIFPIAYETAVQQDLSFTPFAIAIMMAASASFSSPIGYQTNLMVYGPGGYRFTDYLRIGIPLNLSLAAMTIVLTPKIWHF